jgi:hypothetical protein
LAGVDLMGRGTPEIQWKRDIEIIEGSKSYKLHLTLFKSRLDIEDDEGNKIAVDKRDDAIKIEPWGNVKFHRENRHP